MKSVMKRILFAVLVFLPAVAGADDDDDAAKLTKIDCSQQADHALNDNKGTFEFTGTCGTISVQGNDNTVRLDKAKTVLVPGNTNTVAVGGVDRIVVAGNANKVTWKKGLTKAKPKISAPGNANKIAKAK